MGSSYVTTSGADPSGRTPGKNQYWREFEESITTTNVNISEISDFQYCTCKLSGSECAYAAQRVVPVPNRLFFFFGGGELFTYSWSFPLTVEFFFLQSV